MRGNVGSSALRIVESAPFYEEMVQLWADSEEHQAHSIHDAVPYPDGSHPDLAAHFIRKFSKKGQVVLDPFCGSGTTALEAALAGRIAYACDTSPLAARITAAKLCPSDITEVTLRLQTANLKRPFNTDLYREKFASFYDVNTFREISNVRSFLTEQFDATARFIQVMMNGILHGHTAGFLSVYSFPQISLSTREQESLNVKRRQTPDYRAVIPRLLRKSASVLRDGIPSILENVQSKSQVKIADGRNLSFCSNESVDLLLTTPPIPGERELVNDFWLRYWFSQLPYPESAPTFSSSDLSGWLDFMNEVLLEGARVVRPGGRAVLDLREIRVKAETLCLDYEVKALVESGLSRYWEPECVLINTPRPIKIRNALKERENGKPFNRVLVLRRR